MTPLCLIIMQGNCLLRKARQLISRNYSLSNKQKVFRRLLLLKKRSLRLLVLFRRARKLNLRRNRGKLINLK